MRAPPLFRRSNQTCTNASPSPVGFHIQTFKVGYLVGNTSFYVGAKREFDKTNGIVLLTEREQHFKWFACVPSEVSRYLAGMFSL